MAPLHLLEKGLQENTVEPELAPTVVEELEDILEKSGPSADPDGVYWHYSVPAAGVRYYGFPQALSSQRPGQEVTGQ